MFAGFQISNSNWLNAASHNHLVGGGPGARAPWTSLKSGPGNEQQNKVCQYYTGHSNEVQKLDLWKHSNKVFVHDNERLYRKLYCSATSF